MSSGRCICLEKGGKEEGRRREGRGRRREEEGREEEGREGVAAFYNRICTLE